MTRKHILRRVIIVLAVIACIICESSITRAFSLTASFPNLLIIIVVFYGFFNGRREGIFAGFVAGLCLDLFSGTTIGYNALVYMYIGFFSGIFKRVFYNEDVLMPLSLVAISDFVYNCFFYIFNFLVRNKLRFGYYLVHTILPEIIFTVITALILYRFALIYHRKRKQAEDDEKGSVETIG